MLADNGFLALEVSQDMVSILSSHRRDPGSIPCNVTFCPNLEIVTQDMVLPTEGVKHFAV
jgi:hypothetical protein